MQTETARRTGRPPPIRDTGAIRYQDMWPFKKTARQRRLRPPRAASASESAWGRFCRAGGVGGLLVAVLLYAGTLAMDLSPLEPFPYRLGQYVPEDIHARHRFRILVPALLDEARDRAERITPAVFQLDEAVGTEIGPILRGLPRRQPPATQPAGRDAGPAVAPRDPNRPSPWRIVAEDPNALKAYNEKVDGLVAQLPSAFVVRVKDPQQHKPQWRWPNRALLLGGAEPVEKTVEELVDAGDPVALGQLVSRLAATFDEALRIDISAALARALSKHPTYRYDKAATQDRIDRAVAAVEADPPLEAYKVYDVGERIAQSSRRKDASGQTLVEGLQGAQLAILRAEHEAVRDRIDAWPVSFWSRVAGRAALLALVVGMGVLYVAKYEPALAREYRRAAALLVAILALLAVNKVLLGMLHANPYVSVLPTMFVAAVLAIAWGQRFALAVGAGVASLVVLQARGGMELFLVHFAGVAAVVFQLGEIRTRTKLIRAAGVWAAVVFLAVWVVELAEAVPWAFALVDAVWAGGCAVLVGLLIQGLLPLIEHVFQVVTSLTLLEWCDASRPLLRRLAMEAPGTYNHSLQLGAMCEAAAEAIGARGLLARVGAYYHDIGKINKPDYFVENHAGATSKHDKLSPAMSLLIIIGHVKDGLEMAREYGLPHVLREFIVTHNGTTLVQYFYKAATEQRLADSDRAPDEVEFRYPGPKPHAMEAAILMVADAAESSVRSMSEPTPGRIENQVHTMVTRRLMDGQLDECELTLRQVHGIETSLIKSLCGIYHARIAYPTPPGEKPSAGELEAARKKDGQGKVDAEQEKTDG